MDRSRRSFIHASALAALAAGCSGGGSNNAAPAANAATNQPAGNAAPEPRPPVLDPTDHRGLLIGPGGRTRDGEKENWLSFVDLDRVEEFVSGAAKPALLPISFPGHAVVPHPIERHRAGIFEKWGPGACEVDMRAMTVLRQIETVPEREFYGHAAWSKDGSLLYAVESTKRSLGAYDGVIAVRNWQSMKLLGEFPTFGKSPHDCHILDDGKTLAITNGGGGPDEDNACVTFVDIASEKLLDSVPIAGLMAGHLAISARSSKGDLAVGSTPHSPPGSRPEGFKTVPGGLTLRPGGGKAVTMSEPAEVTKKMLGETLSLVIQEELGVVGATNPAGNIVTFWDIKQGKHLKSFDLPLARGIALTLDKRYFVVSYASNSSIVLIRAADLVEIEASRFKPSGIAGSHAIVYEL